MSPLPRLTRYEPEATGEGQQCADGIPKQVPLLLIGEEMGVLWTAHLLSNQGTDTFLFLPVSLRCKETGKMSQTQPEQIRGQGVALVVLDDACEIAVTPEFCDMPTIHVHLARNPGEESELVQRGGPISPPTDQLQEINMPVLCPRKIIDPFPRLGRAPAEVRDAEAMDEPALQKNFEVRRLRVEADDLRLAFPQLVKNRAKSAASSRS